MSTLEIVKAYARPKKSGFDFASKMVCGAGNTCIVEQGMFGSITSYTAKDFLGNKRPVYRVQGRGGLTHVAHRAGETMHSASIFTFIFNNAARR